MAGLTVNRSQLDTKVSQVSLELRRVYGEVETLYAWLTAHPVTGGVDPLIEPVTPTSDGMATTGFGYTPDEAALIRSVFDKFHSMFDTTALESSRKFTGLN